MLVVMQLLVSTSFVCGCLNDAVIVVDAAAPDAANALTGWLRPLHLYFFIFY